MVAEGRTRQVGQGAHDQVRQVGSQPREQGEYSVVFAMVPVRLELECTKVENLEGTGRQQEAGGTKLHLRGRKFHDRHTLGEVYPLSH